MTTNEIKDYNWQWQKERDNSQYVYQHLQTWLRNRTKNLPLKLSQSDTKIKCWHIPMALFLRTALSYQSSQASNNSNILAFDHYFKPYQWYFYIYRYNTKFPNFQQLMVQHLFPSRKKKKHTNRHLNFLLVSLVGYRWCWVESHLLIV